MIAKLTTSNLYISEDILCPSTESVTISQSGNTLLITEGGRNLTEVTMGGNLSIYCKREIAAMDNPCPFATAYKKVEGGVILEFRTL